jgi:hypothetical protein
VASHYPDEGGTDHPSHNGTRAKLQDSYVYYAELLVSVDGHSLPVPPPRPAPDDRDQDPRPGDTRT